MRTEIAPAEAGTACNAKSRVQRENLVCAKFAFIAMLGIAPTSVRSQVQIQFDSRFDSSGFFDAPERRAILNAAANEFSSRFTDSLSPIEPSGGNSWNALIIRPDTGTMELLQDMAVPADTITVLRAPEPWVLTYWESAKSAVFRFKGEPTGAS
ncbi:MAG: hypothetical protein O2960_08540 [Verrucomicrobia bacterium]|nr:hypothetical protein [Verrucomicrobiota bacterium]